MIKLFTADTHFGQERTLTLSRRPFMNTKSMDMTMISLTNKKIWTIKENFPNENIVLMHLGDFGDYTNVKKYNCPVILIIGNYEEQEIRTYPGETDDEKFRNFREKLINEYGFKDVLKPNEVVSIEFMNNDTNMREIRTVTMVHRPLDFIKKRELKDSNSFDTDYCIFGHIHGRQKIKKFGIDVGVDCNNFTPVTESDIGFYLEAIEKFYDDEVFC